jgi:hypothetical protein
MEIQWGMQVDALRALIARIPGGQLNGIIEDMKDEDVPREQIDLIRQLQEGS